MRIYLLVALGLVGCFASHTPPCDEEQPYCSDRESEVDTCEGLFACADYTWCGGPLFCVDATCRQERPQCEGNRTEVETCTSLLDCFEDEWCGGVVYCAALDPCEPQDIYGAGNCLLSLGWHWTGTECESLGGCTLEGADAAFYYPMQDDCLDATDLCPE